MANWQMPIELGDTGPNFYRGYAVGRWKDLE